MLGLQVAVSSQLTKIKQGGQAVDHTENEFSKTIVFSLTSSFYIYGIVDPT